MKKLLSLALVVLMMASPATADFVVVPATLALISLAGVAISKKRR